MKKRRLRRNKRSKDHYTDWLLDHFPAKLKGDTEVISNRLISSFGPLDFDEEIKTLQKRNVYLYLILIGLLATFILSQLLPSGNPIDLSRSEYGGTQKVVPIEVEAEFNGATIKKDVDLVVQPKILSEHEKTKRLESTKERLPKLVAGDNVSLSDVSYDLNFIEVDPKTGVELSWYTTDDSPIDNEGTVDVLDAERGERATITARLTLEDRIETVKIVSIIGTIDSSIDYGRSLENEVDSTVKNINDNSDGNELTLPSHNSSGVRLNWNTKKENDLIVLIPVFMLIAVFVYKNRYSAIDKKVELARESIVHDFPDLLNKLLLLLDAGLVVTSAFNKVADDYRKERENYGRRYLYDEISSIEERVAGANASLCVELMEFAQRSGVRELMRFASIISDNIDKGALLSEKLKSESEMIWSARKKRAEEKGMIAETKLTFPMVLLLLVLIMITAAPAMLEM